MAGTKTFTNASNGTYGSHYPQSLIVSWDDYDISNNRTYVRITYQRSTDNQSVYHNYGYANPSQISIDGNQVASATPYSAHNTQVTQTLCSWEGWIYHDNEGRKSFGVSASFSSSSSNLPSGSVSGSVDLPTIPRASEIGVLDANIGSSTTITINKKINNSSTDLFWRVQGDSNWTFIENTSQTSYAWTVPTSLYSRIPNNKTIVCEFLARTWSNGSNIGDKTTSATFTATGNPIINSCELVSIDTKTVDLIGNNKMIRYISTVRSTVTATPQNSSSIASIKVNNITATNGIVEIANANTNSFEVIVIDSRGYSTTQTFTMEWTDYIPLTLSATATRNQPTDNKVRISYSGNYFNDVFKSDNEDVSNTLIVEYRSREKGGTWGNWISLTPTISDNSYLQNVVLNNYDYQKQYEFEMRAVDKVKTTDTISISVSKGIPVYNWGEDFFNINGELRIFNQAILTNLYPVGSIYMSVNNTNPSTYFGGTWVEWGSGRVPVGVNTSDSDFNTVEKTGGSKALQQHSHTGTTNGAGGHNHQVGADDDGAGGSSWSTIHKAGTSGAGRLVDTSWVGDHTHTFTTDNAGSGDSGNLQPYITCYMWKRTA